LPGLLMRIPIQYKVPPGAYYKRHCTKDRMPDEKLAIIIATKDRPKEIKRLLESVCSQDLKPAQVIIVDGGNSSCKEVEESFPDLRIDYVRKVPASLTVQRNIGISRLAGDVTLAAFLDDDIVIEDGALKNMVSFFKAAPADVGGASFNNMSDRYKKPTLPEKIFFVNTDSPGRILRSGFQSKLCSLGETTSVEWLVGCAMVYRKSVFSEFSFDEYFSGYARYEDVDFSYRVGRKYKLFVVADARVQHLNSLEPVSFSFALGRMEFINRLYFTGKNPDLSMGLCYWALFGLFLNNIIKGLFLMDKRHLNRARGNLAGFASRVKPLKP
jgi:GT2 family glycosyltransferase